MESSARLSEDARNVLAEVAQCRSSALELQTRGEAAEAVDLLDRAVNLCGPHESDHPVVCLEAARCLLSLAAARTASGQRLKASLAAEDAVRRLARLRAWAQGDGAEEAPACAAAIEEEAGALERVALAVWARDQPRETGAAAPVAASTQDGRSSGEAVARSKLAATLPTGFSTGSGNGASASASHAESSGKLTLPRLPSASGSGGAGGAWRGGPGASATISSMASTAPAAALAAAAAGGAEGGGGASSSAPRPRAKASGAGNGNGGGADGGGGARRVGRGKAEAVPFDIFKDFLRRAAQEKEARQGALRDKQEYDRKRLKQVHRTTRLMLDLMGDDDLKQKRYTFNGHKVMMQSMQKENRSRSDPSLVREAQKFGESPELYEVRKLMKHFNRPVTPAKPVVLDGLSLRFGS
eukprot:TRINITY_DN55233_c0_g1_i1.p2 TRINITY_DN55233_c0_g1~~TRINITY_DN55233_c0_g1_i1.p2  ORF type:complete len:412 (-),score=116.44 TRINITY_DN55233_c0_g1_i1:28-1263(-)